MIFDSRKRFRSSACSGNQHADVARRERNLESDLNDILKPIDRWVGRHPAICLGLAVAAGVTFGCFVKRR